MNLGEDKNADDARKDNMFHPTIEHEARWVSWVVEDVHLIAYRIFRFDVKTMPEGKNSGAKLLPSRLVFNNRRPDPRTPFWIIVDNSFHAYDGATRMDPNAADVAAPPEWRKRHKHDCAKTNEVTHGIIDKNVDLEALALEYRFLDRGSTLPVLRPTTAAGGAEPTGGLLIDYRFSAAVTIV